MRPVEKHLLLIRLRNVFRQVLYFCIGFEIQKTMPFHTVVMYQNKVLDHIYDCFFEQSFHNILLQIFKKFYMCLQSS